jgi:glycosyltransferase involved in cell wall biosynthesis
VSTAASPTRIALFASSFHPHPGGVEELVRQLAHAQQAAGLEPVVYTMRWPKSLPAREELEGTPVRRYVFRSPGLPARRLGAALVLGPIALVQFVLELRRQRGEVLHIECVSPAGWYALQATRLLRLPLVVTMQGELTMDATGLYQRSWWARRTLRLLLRRADVITACSAHTLREAEEWFGSPFGARASVIHNGVDVSDFDAAPAPRSDEPYVFAIGRHVRQKGFDLLLDAYASLVDRPGFDHRLVIAGDGPERGALERRAVDLGIAERVDFVGATDRAATASWFRGADVFVLPSRHEPFGIVVLEALAAGVPVVAADVGGVAEFLPDTPLTRLADPDRPASLAAGIEAILSRDDRRLDADPAVSDALADALSAHTWTVLERAYAQRYEEAAARAR